MAKNSIKVTTPKFRLSYPHLERPSSSAKNAPPKYSIEMIIPKSTDITKIKQAIHDASVERWGENKEKWPARDLPLKDGDKLNAKADLDGKLIREEIKDSWVVVARNAQRPALFDRDGSVVGPEMFYPGCYARAMFGASAYTKDQVGNNGVAFYLNGVQFHSHGERFGGDNMDMFDPIQDDGMDDVDDLDDL